MANHFLVFIGGTGAKCAEAFVHMATAGAGFDPSDTFHVLTVDVDATNGNRSLMLDAIGRYQLLREEFPASGQFAQSTLFGPRIHHYDWHVQLPKDFPRAAGTNCLSALRAQNSPDEEAVMRLFYTDEEMSFDFSKEGFHAIPAIGAPVLSHILESGEGLGDFPDFVDAVRSEVGVNSRLIVIGSIFGGTGACGIPELTRALTDRTRDLSLAGNLVLSGVLLLPYYHFAEPSPDDDLGVHARKFYNNARGALAFYRDMESELSFDSLYLIGSPIDYNMGAYRPGMESQKNPPTPVEWEAALAIAHCLEKEPGEPGEPAKQYIKRVLGFGQDESAQRLSAAFSDFSISIQREMGTMARFIAAYMGYYKGYIKKYRGAHRGFKPFYQELLRPYVETQEAERKGLAALSDFCARYWVWLKQSLTYDQLTQTCFSDRMMHASGYPVKALSALIEGEAGPTWAKVEDTLFDGIRPLLPEEADFPQRSAGLFVHGLFAHCAP